MGCTCVRESIPKEEEAITLMESQLEYFKNSCIQVDHIIRKYSTTSIINPSQWADICDHLELKTENNLVSPKVEDFYASIKLPNGDFELKTLLILGIFLSNGMSRQKARLLFEIYDEKNSDFLDKSQISELLDKIKGIIVDKLPILVHNSTNPPSSSQNVIRYSQKVSRAFNFGKGKLMEMIFGDKSQVNVRDFAILFDNEENGRILAPYGFRLYLGQFIFEGHQVFK